MSKRPEEGWETSLWYFLPQERGAVHLWGGLLFSSKLLKLDTTLVREEDGALGQHK